MAGRSAGDPRHPMHDADRNTLQHGIQSAPRGRATDTRRPQHGDPAGPDGQNPPSPRVAQNIPATFTDYGPKPQKQYP